MLQNASKRVISNGKSKKFSGEGAQRVCLKDAVTGDVRLTLHTRVNGRRRIPERN